MVVKREGKKWVIRSHTGKKLGSYSKKSAAVKRLREIEYFKRKNK